MEQVLKLIGDEWTVFVLFVLIGGTKRYSQLQREIGTISQKMLTQTLRKLEQDGLVERKVHPVVPPVVEYSLTALGQTLVEPIEELGKWAEQHMDEVNAAQAHYQAAHN